MERKKIIVRMPNWLGDFVMATAALQKIKEVYPESRLIVMCKKAFLPLLKNDRNIDGFLPFEQIKGWFNKEKKEVIERIKKEKFDKGVLFTNSFSSAYLFWRGKVKIRIGYKAHCRSFLVNEKKSFPKNIRKTHQVDIYKGLISAALKENNFIPKIDLADSEIALARSLLEKEGAILEKIIVGISPLSAYGEAKCWPQERYLQLATELLKDRDLFVIFVGDRPIFSKEEKEKWSSLSRMIDLGGKTDVSTLAGVIKLCNLFVTNDSGPMHLAHALGVSLVAIFGSTCDIMTGPYHGGEVIHKKVACSPCFRRSCKKDFSCMKNVEVGEVLFLVNRYLYAKKNT